VVELYLACFQAQDSIPSTTRKQKAIKRMCPSYKQGFLPHVFPLAHFALPFPGLNSEPYCSCCFLIRGSLLQIVGFTRAEFLSLALTWSCLCCDCLTITLPQRSSVLMKMSLLSNMVATSHTWIPRA
jgi:hypothetical protein